jgi:hypothetical protein
VSESAWRGRRKRKVSSRVSAGARGFATPNRPVKSTRKWPLDQTADAVVVRGRSDLVDAGGCES